MLALRDVSKTYLTPFSAVDALIAIDLDIREGEFVAITGRSGSGKSTLLNILGLTDGATAGSYLFCGTQVAGLAERTLAGLRRRNASFIFQRTCLVDSLTVRANVELGVRYRLLAASARRRLVDEAMDMVGIGHRAHLPVHILSAGQQRRVEIARAFANRPRILFADEPAGDLDPAFSDHMRTALRALNRAGTTIVLATHAPDQAAAADQIVYLVDGMRMPHQPSLAPLRATAGYAAA